MSICIPTQLSDSALVASLSQLVRSERNATSRLVAHLAEFDARKLHLAAGFPSLFAYCCEVLHLSEPETANRIVAARLARKFPVALERLESAVLNLTTLRLLSPHLTKDNHLELLAAAAYKTKADVEELIAHRFPRPDVASSTRKLPARAPVVGSFDPTPSLPSPACGADQPPSITGSGPLPEQASLAAEPTATPPLRRGVVAPLAPDGYEIRFTATAETRTKLRRAQEQLSHAVPSGDLATIFDRALSALLDDLARSRLQRAKRSRPLHGLPPHPVARQARGLAA